MENWWEAAPVATDKEEAKTENWWDAAPAVTGTRDNSSLSRVGKAFDLGEAAAITGGQEMTRDMGAALETSALGRGLDTAGSFFDRTFLTNEDGTPNMLGRAANFARSFGAEQDGVPRQLVGGPDVTPQQRREAILNKDLGAAYDGARGVLAQLAAEDFTPMSYDEVNGLGSFTQFVAENLAASAPQMGASIAAGPLGPTLNVVLLGSEANQELKERTDLTLDQRVAVATGAGTLMAGLEQFGLLKMLGPISPGKLAVDALDGKLVDTLVQKGVPDVVARTIETAVVEGSTEALQEATVMGVTALSGGEYTAAEVADRLAQSFTAGAAVGGTVGAVTNAAGGREKKEAISVGETSPDVGAALAGTPVATAPTNAQSEVAPDQAAALNVTMTPADVARGILGQRNATPTATPAGNVAATPTPAPVTPAPVTPAPATPAATATPAPTIPAATATPAPTIPDPAPAPADAPVTEGTELEETVLADTALNEEVPDGAEAAGDTLPTVPEAPETLAAQAEALVDRKSKRRAVYIPPETLGEVEADALPMGKNVFSMRLPNGGMLFWNYTKIGLGKKDVLDLYKDGSLGQLLGLGPFNKAEVAASGGTQDLAVREINKDGVAVKDVSATEVTAAQQMAALEAEKDEGSEIVVQPAEEVIAERQAAPKAEKAKRVSKGRGKGKKAPEPDAPVKTKADFTPEEIAEIEKRANAKPARGVFWDKTQMKSMIEVATKDGKLEVREATPAEVAESTKKFNDKVAERATELAKEGEDKPLAITDKTSLQDRRAAADRGEFKNAKDEMKARIPDNSKEGENTIKERTRQAELGDSIREKFGPKDGVENLGQIDDIEARFKETLEAADRTGVKIPNEVSGITPNSLAWLAQMKLMQGKIAKLRTARSKSGRESILAALADYLGAELDYMQTGSSEGFRATRKEVADSIATSAKAPSTLDTDEDMMGQIADENAVDMEEQLDAQREEQEQPETRPVEKDESPEFEAGDNVVVMLGGEGELGTIVSGPKMRGDRAFYRVRFADGAMEEFPADGYNMFKAPKRAQITSEGNDVPGMFSRELDDEDFYTLPELEENAESLAPMISMIDPDTMDWDDVQDALRSNIDTLGVPYFDQSVSVGERAAVMSDLDMVAPEQHLAVGLDTVDGLRQMMSDKDVKLSFFSGFAFNMSQTKVLAKVADKLYNMLADLVGDVKIYTLEDTDFERFVGRNAAAYYQTNGDYIVMRKSLWDEDNRDRFAHVLIHEVSHAAFVHVMHNRPALQAQVRALMDMAQKWKNDNGYVVDEYGFTNEDEFVSESFSNPEFQEFLAQIPVNVWKAASKGLNLAGVRGRVRTALDAVRAFMIKAFNIPEMFRAAGADPNTPTMLDAMMTVADNMLAASTVERATFYQNYPDMSAPIGVKAIQQKPEPNSIEGKLRSRGLSPMQAKEVADVIDSEFGGKATDAELDAIAQKIALAMTGQTPSASNTGSPRIDKATKEADTPQGKNATGWRAFLLKLRTLDDIVRSYGDRFMDKEGNALLDYLNSVFSYEPVRREVEDRHNMDFANFEDFRKENPEEAEKLADLITELAPYDVNLGPNADNSHLDGNAKANLQAKAKLPDLQAKYDALSPEAQAIMNQMSANYRESHNDAVRGVVYNALSLLNTKLSNSEVMRLMEAAVEGTLTEADAQTIGDDTVFQTLVNAKELRLRKGMYFPSVRFGDYVVVTKAAVPNPGMTQVRLKVGGKKQKGKPGKVNPTVPVTSEVIQEDGTVRFIVNPEVRGARTALDRAVSAWVSTQDLPMLSYRIKYKDRTTGELVTRSGQRLDRDYDYVIEVRFQNQGVHFFEDPAEAAAFSEQAKRDMAAGTLFSAGVVESRHNTSDLGNVIKGSVAEALMRTFDARNTDDDGTKTRRAQAQALLQEIIAQQLPGNRYEKRLLKRKNVAGFSKEVGRSAAHYGRQVGNYIAAVQTGPARHEAFDRILEIERGRGRQDGVISQVVNELRSREQEVGQNHHTSQLADNLVMINGWDKLASAANWMINGTQVLTNSLSMLGGRHGAGAASSAIAAAYGKIGTGSTLMRGVRNTAQAATRVGNIELQTEDLVEAVRTKLGPKYHDLIDAMRDTGDIALDVGIESATQLSGGAGSFTKGIAKVDRIVRQMPNTMEAINRAVTAVAAYDLGRKDGMTHVEAIAYAQDVTRQTQGRYDLANSPVWMQRAGILRFALVFKKYAQLQYQLLGDIVRRSFDGATETEKKVARKQLGMLMGINFAVGGMLGLPGIELFKVAALAGMALGGEEWEEWQEKWRESVRSFAGKDIEQAINKGALSKVLDVDLQSRMGWQDMITGFAPKELNPEGFTSFIGTTILGAPGGMAVDMLRAREAWEQGEVLKALSFMIPIKQVVDTAKTVQGVEDGKMSTGDAVRQVIGFRSLRQAEIGDQIGSEIRDSKARQGERKDLERAFMNANTPAERARATAAIRRYNNSLPDGQRRISINALRRYQEEDKARYAQ